MQIPMKHNSPEIRKLKKLCHTLLNGMKKCDEVVRSISNDTLRKTLITLEQQNFQYIKELNAQIEILGGKPLTIDFEHLEGLAFLVRLSKKAAASMERKALKVCREIENSAIGLYNTVIEETVNNESLQKLIQYQRNGIMCTSQQLKLLAQFIHKK